MKGLGLFLFKILLIIVAILSILYFLDVPVTQVAGENIGFADLVNFFLFQPPPGLPEVDAKNNTEVSAFASEIEGSSLGDAAGALAKIGNPIRFCVFRDYSYCQNFRIDDGKLHATGDTAQKTVYMSYHLAMELRTRVETQNFQDIQKRFVQAVKSGEIKGLSITDVMSLGG